MECTRHCSQLHVTSEFENSAPSPSRSSTTSTSRKGGRRRRWPFGASLETSLPASSTCQSAPIGHSANYGRFERRHTRRCHSPYLSLATPRLPRVQQKRWPKPVTLTAPPPQMPPCTPTGLLGTCRKPGKDQRRPRPHPRPGRACSRPRWEEAEVYSRAQGQAQDVRTLHFQPRCHLKTATLRGHVCMMNRICWQK